MIFLTRIDIHCHLFISISVFMRSQKLQSVIPTFKNVPSAMELFDNASSSFQQAVTNVTLSARRSVAHVAESLSGLAQQPLPTGLRDLANPLVGPFSSDAVEIKLARFALGKVIDAGFEKFFPSPDIIKTPLKRKEAKEWMLRENAKAVENAKSESVPSQDASLSSYGRAWRSVCELSDKAGLIIDRPIPGVPEKKLSDAIEQVGFFLINRKLSDAQGAVNMAAPFVAKGIDVAMNALSRNSAATSG